MEQIDRKKLLVILVFGCAGLFFITSNLFLPLYSKNKKLAQELRESKDKERIVREVFKDPQRLSQIKKEMAETDSFLSAKMPEERDVAQLVRILSRSGKEAFITVDSINSGQAKELNFMLLDALLAIPYEALPVTMSLRGSLVDFIRCLGWLKDQERLINVQSFFITPERMTKGAVNVIINLQGYSFSLKGLPYIKPAEDLSFDQGYIRKALALPQAKEISFSSEDVGEMFGDREALSEKDPAATEAGSREEELKLFGTVIKPHSRAAIINNKMVKENESINNYRVVKIEDDRVILERGGREIILGIKK